MAANNRICTRGRQNMKNVHAATQACTQGRADTGRTRKLFLLPWTGFVPCPSSCMPPKPSVEACHGAGKEQRCNMHGWWVGCSESGSIPIHELISFTNAMFKNAFPCRPTCAQRNSFGIDHPIQHNNRYTDTHTRTHGHAHLDEPVGPDLAGQGKRLTEPHRVVSLPPLQHGRRLRQRWTHSVESCSSGGGVLHCIQWS